MGDDWAVPGSDKWDQLYASSDDEDPAEPADESTVRGVGPLGSAPEPQPSSLELVGPPQDPITHGRERLHSMLRSSCEWWDRTELSPSAREEWFSVKGQWSKPSKDGECSLDVLGVPMAIRNKQLQQEQERKDASMAIELSNQDAQEEVALIQQMAKDAELARTLETDGAQQPATDLSDEHMPSDNPWGAPGVVQRTPRSGSESHSPHESAQQMLVVEVLVPPQAQPGSKLQVEIPDGRSVEVTLPATARSGEHIRVQVPTIPTPVGQSSSTVGRPGFTDGLAVDELDEEAALARALAESMTPTPRVQASAAAPTRYVDERLVGELIVMGIEEDVAAAAAMAVGNRSVEAAMEHIFSGAAAATTSPPSTRQVDIPLATPLPTAGADTATAPTPSQDDIVLLPQASAPPAIGNHSTSDIGGTTAAPTPSAAVVVAPGTSDETGVDERISQVCAMGFSREAAASALEVSHQSVEGAIDLLLSQPPT